MQKIKYGGLMVKLQVQIEKGIEVLKKSPIDNRLEQNVLEYKAMNAKLGNCACVVRSNTCKPYREMMDFLHSFCNFLKSNVFGKNFIRTEFILHKIFFRMSILSSRKTLRMFFNLCWKKLWKIICGRTWPFWGEGSVWRRKSMETFLKKMRFWIFFM